MIESKQVEYAKELDDALVLAVELFKDIKAKKDAGAIASENLPLLMNAFNGLDQVDDEFKANKAAAINAIALRVGELIGVLLPA